MKNKFKIVATTLVLTFVLGVASALPVKAATRNVKTKVSSIQRVVRCVSDEPGDMDIK